MAEIFLTDFSKILLLRKLIYDLFSISHNISIKNKGTKRIKLSWMVNISWYVSERLFGIRISWECSNLKIWTKKESVKSEILSSLFSRNIAVNITFSLERVFIFDRLWNLLNGNRIQIGAIQMKNCSLLWAVNFAKYF